jgi:CRISPR-associated protein Cas1
VLFRSAHKLDHPNKKEMANTIKLISDSKSLLGVEGNFSKIFYQTYFKKINWYRRSPRAKEDIPNLLLDLGYTFLFNFIDSLLQLYGFDTFKGVYHKLFFQRKSLACDLMEPFRPIIDKQLLKSYNLGQIKTADFTNNKGTVSISYKKISTYTKIFMTAIMDHKVDIHQYIQIYYYYILNDTKKFPKFKLR